MNEFDYSGNEIIVALKKIGLEKGDNVFVHSNIGFFGKLQGYSTKEDYWRIFKKSIFDVIGEFGTLIVPTFTYSYCWNQVYDKNNTPSTTGLLSELLRNDPESLRSEDANFSITALGYNALLFTEKMPEHSFGKNSFWERFLNLNGKICCFNVGLNYNTFIHYVEKILNVPYRYDKKFLGKSVINGKIEEKTYTHYVRDLENINTFPDLTEFVKICKELNVIQETNLGRGIVSCISAKDTFEIIKAEIKKNPNLLIKGIENN